jgi:multiple sugar transport system substrate-binding protein
MKKRIYTLLSCLLTIIIFVIGCNSKQVLNPKNPITLTLWHNYGGQMKNSMDEMVDEFNETLGKEKGIVLNVTSISSSATLHEKLTMAANGDPGVPALPDITTAYPKTALRLKEKDLLVDLNEYFTTKELSAYIPQFLEEGKLDDDGLYVFPAAKSTEVLFVNTTIFNKFSRDTGVKLKDLETFEGIIRTAELYHQWSGGKMFYMADSLFNFTQVGYRQLDGALFKDGKMDLSNPYFGRIWNCLYEPGVLGYVAIFDGYASDLAKTGDIVCSTGSTAGVVFFSPNVTYEDNTTEPANLAILPYPTFEGGKKIAIQRGSGMCVIKSNKEKEYGASVFLKWFTSPENNLRFVSSTGYLPVTEDAFDKMLSLKVDNITDENIIKLLHTTRKMQKEYDFYITPLFEGIDELQIEFDSQLKKEAMKSRERYLELLENKESDNPFEAATEGVYESFIDGFK